MTSNSRHLATPLTGVQRLHWAEPLDVSQEITMAAWQSVHKGQAERCVIRCDGHIQNYRNLANTGMGFPCGVLRVDYTIGGYQASTHVDAVNQSALTLWANTVEVTAIWDRRRIERLAAFYADIEASNPGPCLVQHMATAISSLDYGPSNARWLDVITYNNHSETGTSYHPIPAGARAVRFLNGTYSNGTIYPIANALTGIKWQSFPPASSDIRYIHQDMITHADCTLDVPAGTNTLRLDFSQNGESELISPCWVEWLLAPKA